MSGEKHPHARGEDDWTILERPTDGETPPRTWGRRLKNGAELWKRRNTPTHVGKTITPKRLSSIRQETPPRTWGRHIFRNSAASFSGNTPTHVGKTGSGHIHHCPAEKHPHARGEDRLDHGLAVPEMGNTPTHVGKTVLPVLMSQMPRKHPHARGEDESMYLMGTSLRETPPRTWGRLAKNRWGLPDERNTPTHVGKTYSHHLQRVCVRKHPHARGEDRNKTLNRGATLETPPRTWGRPCDKMSVLHWNGNTPTHVGKTLAISIGGSLQQKHPHARGED